MTTVSAETIRYTPVRTRDNLTFRPKENGDKERLNAKILSAYATARRIIEHHGRPKLIVGTPIIAPKGDPHAHTVKIGDIYVDTPLGFSVQRVLLPDIPIPGVYAKRKGKTYFIGPIIERALEQKLHVFLVPKELVKKINPVRQTREKTGRYSVPRSKQIPLVTQDGVDLRSLSPEEFNHRITHLIEKQRRRLIRAYEGATAPMIGTEDHINPRTVRDSIEGGLKRLDTPKRKSKI